MFSQVPSEARIPPSLKYNANIGSGRCYLKRGSCIFTSVPRVWCFDEKYLRYAHIFSTARFFPIHGLRPVPIQRRFTSHQSIGSMKSVQFFIRFSRSCPLTPRPNCLECPQLITTPVKHTLTSVTLLSLQFVPAFEISLKFLAFQMKTSHLLE